MDPARRVSRRAVLGSLAATAYSAAAAPLLAGPATSGLAAGHQPAAGREPAARTPRSRGWFAPGDDVRHERTWMAWPRIRPSDS